MATVTAPWWLLWVVAGLAVCGFWGAVWLAMAGLARVRYWWCDRPRIMWIRDWWYDRQRRPTPLEELPPPLPPERTWEQMTSHQLPLAGPSPRIRDWLERDDPAEDDGSDGCVVPSSPESASAAAAIRTPIGTLTAARERRALAWEAEHRAHYVAMGFDYPSGLVARVREAAQ